jgi:hypothetical protein
LQDELPELLTCDEIKDVSGASRLARFLIMRRANDGDIAVNRHGASKVLPRPSIRGFELKQLFPGNAIEDICYTKICFHSADDDLIAMDAHGASEPWEYRAPGYQGGYQITTVKIEHMNRVDKTADRPAAAYNRQVVTGCYGYPKPTRCIGRRR